jgi:NADH-quinone oxidoreductase subunit A
MTQNLDVCQPLEDLLFYTFITTLVAVLLLAVSKAHSALTKYSDLNDESTSMYECGFEPFQEPQDSFFIQYFSIAVLFLIFELEFLYLIP